MKKTITVESLRIVINHLFERMKKQNIDELIFDENFYWLIPIEQLVVQNDEQPELLVGSLNDDIDFLNSLIEEEYSTNYLELERLSSLFRFMSKKFRGSNVMEDVK